MKPQLFGSLLVTVCVLSACGDDTGTTGASSTTGTGGSGGGATTSSTGGQGTGGTVLDGPGLGEACDVMAQNCADPSAPKCTLDFSDMEHLPATCQQSYGDAMLDAACTNPTMMGGIDTCAPGMICGHFQGPHCYAHCESQGDCPGDHYCSRINSPTDDFDPDTRLIGACLPSCEFFDASTCATGLKCLSNTEVTGVKGFTCFTAGTGDVGDACTKNVDCKPLLGCDLSIMTCAPFCDPTHTCPVNTACAGFSGGDIGICRGAPATWTCDPQQYADGTNCDCDCGPVDPDCADTMKPVVGCTGPDVCKNGNCVPPTWTCNGAWYDSGDGCDCNCGLEDPDCGKPNMMTLGCQMGQTCVAGVCQ